jgi:hypothetical protein
MAEENTESAETTEVTQAVETKSPVKLEIDRPNDFKFHLAYGVYSKAFDENTSDEARTRLNDLISTLSNDENGFNDFYSQVQQYRGGTGGYGSGRVRIETSRKRSWQRQESRAGRERRHH